MYTTAQAAALILSCINKGCMYVYVCIVKSYNYRNGENDYHGFFVRFVFNDRSLLKLIKSNLEPIFESQKPSFLGKSYENT